jgi:hypothetical protein
MSWLLGFLSLGLDWIGYIFFHDPQLATVKGKESNGKRYICSYLCASVNTID